ncbi:MAG: PAS domain S-box protein [Planctomycetes bacterium]|nr:PAS domain S-box protein [Planctomycetota bacterium]
MCDVPALRSDEPPVPYAELIAGIDGIVWEADAKTFQMTYVSPHAERLLGYPAADWLQTDFWPAHLHPDDREAAVAYCLKATAELRVHDFQYRMIAADGRVVWLRDIVTVVAEGGVPKALRGIMIDVTAQRRAEETRAEHIRFLEAMDRVNRAILSAPDLARMNRAVLEVVLEVFEVDRAFLGAPCDPATSHWRCEMECARPEHPGAEHLGVVVATDPEFARLFAALCACDGPVAFDLGSVPPVPARLVASFDVQSVLGMVVRPPLAEPYMFGVHDCEEVRAWTPAQLRLFEAIGRRLTDALGMRLMHERLAASERRFRVLVDHATDAIFLHARDGTVLDVNEQACSSLGRSRESLIGASPREFDLGVEKAVVDRISDRLDAGELLVLDTMHQGPNGECFPVELRIRPFTEAGQRYSVSSARDITERKRAEAELRASHDLLHAVVEGTSDAVFVKDVDGRYLLLNAAGGHLLGRSVASVLGRTDAEIGGRVQLAGSRASEQQVMSTGRECSFEFTVAGDGGERVHSVTTAPYRSAGGEVLGVVGIARDVTDARRLEEQFRQAQKMEAVGRLAGGLAHDFNNLLTVVNGCSELVLMQLAPDAPQRELVREIQCAGERACRLTRQLLAFSRRQLLQPQAVPVNDRLEDLLSLLRRLLGEDVELRLDRAPDVGPAYVDPSQFDQAIVNLAVNARDAMPDGGRITISTSNVEFRAGAAPADLPPGRYVAVTVSDTGIGMDESTRARAFEPFFTTKPPGKGTGLGLAMVYGFVKQSGGHIDLQTKPGRGATFRLWLPRVDQPVLVPRPASDAGSRSRGNETVLLVEDEEAVRSLVRTVLRGSGYRVLEARDGIEGLRVARAHGQKIDLLLTDLVMPHLGGRRLADQLVQERPDLRVLLLSGYADESVAGGAYPLLDKPFSPATLSRRVREVLDDSVPGSAHPLGREPQHATNPRR